MKKSKVNFSKLLFLLLIFLWIIISFFDVGYNFVKLFSESMHWLPLSEFQKGHEVYGNVYDFIVFIGKHTDIKSSILIYSKDDKSYFLGRYYLYPREIRLVLNKNQINQILDKSNFKYVAIDSGQINFKGFIPIASNSSWTIYKQK